MKELLNSYSLDQIAIFIVLLAAAIKGLVSWIEWAKQEISKRFEKKEEANRLSEEFKKDIEDLKDSVDTVNKSVNSLAKTVDLLMESDMDDIKAYITREHHYFCYTLGYIDDYNLDCIEKRYKCYLAEGGNSFVHELMDEIRALPKKSGASLYEEKK